MSVVEGLTGRYFGLVSEAGEDRVLQLLMDLAIQVVDAQSGAILALDESRQSLVFVVATGTQEEQSVLLGQQVPLGKGLTGLAALTHEVQMGAPTFKDVRQTEERGGPEGAPSALIAAPMLIGETLVGVVTAADFRPSRSFKDQDASLLAGFAAIAAVVVDMYRRLRVEKAHEQSAPIALGSAATAEKQILDSITRLSRHCPQQLPTVAALLASVEQLANGNERK